MNDIIDLINDENKSNRESNKRPIGLIGHPRITKHRRR